MSHLDLNTTNHHDIAMISSGPEQRPQRDEHLWFPDGNVVLATDSLLFCVHKGILALQSTVFKDMFDLPVDALDDAMEVRTQETVSGSGVVRQEMYEGRPLVYLAGDGGEDVAHLLRAIYERGCVVLFSFSFCVLNI